MTIKTARKSRGITKVEKEKLDGACFVEWLAARFNAGATHVEIMVELNELPGEDVKKGTLQKWIARHLERRYVIKGIE